MSLLPERTRTLGPSGTRRPNASNCGPIRTFRKTVALGARDRIGACRFSKAQRSREPQPDVVRASSTNTAKRGALFPRAGSIVYSFERMYLAACPSVAPSDEVRVRHLCSSLRQPQPDTDQYCCL